LPGKGNRDLAKEFFWRKALERFAASGKGRAKFCAEEGLSADLLVYWTKAIHERDTAVAGKKLAPSQITPEAFVPITVTDHSNHQSDKQHRAVAEVVFADGSVFLFKGVDSAMLKALFQALRETAH
jgi:hypothetical protein